MYFLMIFFNDLILPYDGNDTKSEDSCICAENVFHKKGKLIENWPLLESKSNH